MLNLWEFEFKAAATKIFATTISTGIVSPILLGSYLIYLITPKPTNIKYAAAAAILSSQPGNGYR
jgi:hypothetical protein